LNRTARLPSTLAALLALALATAAAAKPVSVKGSDTMVILGQRWAEAYMNTTPGQVVMVTGGGSGTGIAALINGTTDICQASRAMRPDEKLKLRDRYQTMGVETPVARDGVTIYVHGSNPVPSLTIAQVRDIYMGRVTNWKQVGGRDATILLYGRENSSGTYGFFKEMVLANRDFADRLQALPGTSAVVNAVSKDPNGIGYGGAAYAKGVKEVPLKKDDGGAPVLPSLASVSDGSYPLSRYLFFYTRQKPAGDVKKFVDWVLTPEGQKIVGAVGYYPLK